MSTKFFRGFKKGLAGGGWRPTAPKTPQKMSPRIMFLYSQGGIGKKGQKKGVNLWFGRDSLRQPPLSANPFSKLLIFWDFPDSWVHFPDLPFSSFLAYYPKDPAVLKTLRVVNHYSDSNLDAVFSCEK